MGYAVWVHSAVPFRRPIKSAWMLAGGTALIRHEANDVVPGPPVGDATFERLQGRRLRGLQRALAALLLPSGGRGAAATAEPAAPDGCRRGGYRPERVQELPPPHAPG